MRRLGQHFLKNRSAIQKIIGALELENGDAIIEIGPGHGELTEEILRQATRNKRQEIKIIAIEKDEKLAGFLKEKFAGDRDIKIIRGDALKILPELCSALPSSHFKIVGNIPYYITGHLLRVIGDLNHKPELCVFTVQKEVAERMAARPGTMNRLAASVQFWAKPQVLEYISKKDFLPPPEVDSAIIKLETRDERREISSEPYYATVRMLFAQPRQTILNNLYRGTKFPKEDLILKLKQAKISPGDRPQNLSIEDIIKISEL